MLKLKHILAACMGLIMLIPQLGSLATPAGAAAIYSSVGAITVMEAEGLQCALDYNGGEVLPAAGLSRLPALLYICEAVDGGLIGEDTSVSVSDAAAAIKGPTAFIMPGESIPAGALVKAAVMITAGDACFALAQSIAGSVTLAEDAIRAMLTSLNIGSGDYTLEAGKQSFTARELCALAARLARSPTYAKYSSLTYDTISHQNASETELANPNKLLRSLNGCFAGSTGSSADAGYCGVFMAKRGDTTYVAAVLGAHDSAQRFTAAAEGLNEAFAAYESATAVKKGDIVIADIPVTCGLEAAVDALASQDVVMLVKRGETVSVMQEKPDCIDAPVKAGDVIAHATYSSESGAAAIRVALVASKDIERTDWSTLILILMRRWVHG